MNKKIAIITAMHKESEPIINALKLSPIDRSFSPLPLKVFDGSKGNVDIILSQNGLHNIHNVDLIGSVPATLNTHEVISTYKPDLVISAGTAGGMGAKGAQIGDVYFSKDNVFFHDRHYYTKGYREHGIGNYPCVNGEWLHDFVLNNNCKFGNLSSGDAFYLSPQQERQWNQNNGEVKDMEAAAVAFVADLHCVPFIGIKVISDIDDGAERIEKQFARNFEFVVAKLAEVTKKFIHYIQT